MPADQPPLVSQPDDADLFDYAKIKDYLLYLLGSISRHRAFICALTAAVLAITALLLWGLPKTYHCETQILALKSTLLGKTVDPNAPEVWGEDPTLAARQAILRHDNLVELVRQTDLVSKYPDSRAPLLKLLDRLAPARSVSQEDRIAAMVGTLETRLDVQVGAGTVTIALDWPDAAMAYQLVDAAHRNFLEQRRATEMGPLEDAIGILELHTSSLREVIVAGVERVEAAREAANQRHPARAGVPATRRPQRQTAEQKREELRAALESKTRAIDAVEQPRRARLEELQTELADARKIFADEHPAVLGLRHQLELQQIDPPELRALKEQRDELRAESARRGAMDVAGGLLGRLPATARQLASATTAEIEDAPIEQAKEDLRFAMSKYLTLLDRIDSAQMHLESAQADFKHRFSVVTPAEVPRAPFKPKKPAILLGGLLGGLALAVFLSALRDLRRGLVFERWQVPRELGIPVLGEIHC
ncbi:MAG TPA: hypothetical protein VH083_02550 [Myxococcales bacterium]|jgi:uncharacterized protein involved in exopolysaccharide biosynthesis|nr:hypothetical protein [Myxococcales bacterium]